LEAGAVCLLADCWRRCVGGSCQGRSGLFLGAWGGFLRIPFRYDCAPLALPSVRSLRSRVVFAEVEDGLHSQFHLIYSSPARLLRSETCSYTSLLFDLNVPPPRRCTCEPRFRSLFLSTYADGCFWPTPAPPEIRSCFPSSPTSSADFQLSPAKL